MAWYNMSCSTWPYRWTTAVAGTAKSYAFYLYTRSVSPLAPRNPVALRRAYLEFNPKTGSLEAEAASCPNALDLALARAAFSALRN